MKMGWLVSPTRDLMDIDIQRFWDQFETIHPRLLLRLTQCSSPDLGLTVDMPTQLQPSAKLAMQGEQAILPVRRQDPTRSGYMPRQASSMQNIFMGIHEGQKSIRDLTLIWMR